MTSLVLLAHEGSRASSAFNGLFYATVATVIPVLFLAIAVQSLLAGGVDAFVRATKMAPLDENSSWREIGTGTASRASSLGRYSPPVGIVLVAVVGEL